MATGTYYLLCAAGKLGGFGPYVGFDADHGFRLQMVSDRSDAKRYFERSEAEADSLVMAAEFGPLDVEARIGLV